jgi:antitoxin (DNA-binding transcriptional repressor) of toxin-antitoxin stability system
MSVRIAATEAALSLPELLDRVKDKHESFVVVREGEEVARISPIEAGQPMTLRRLVELLHRIPPPDPGFAADLVEIQAAQPPLGEAPWHS